MKDYQYIMTINNDQESYLSIAARGFDLFASNQNVVEVRTTLQSHKIKSC